MDKVKRFNSLYIYCIRPIAYKFFLYINIVLYNKYHKKFNNYHAES